MNRYFILPCPNENSSIWDIVVQDESKVRKNLAGTKMVVKLCKGDDANHAMLNGKQEYTHEEILQELNTAEWQTDEE